MLLIDLPSEIIKDLNNQEKWRLDVDYGLDAKHEFFFTWASFIETTEYQIIDEEETRAEFIELEGKNVLLPVPRTHNPYMNLIRLIKSDDERSVTLFLHDRTHKEWFQDPDRGARFGYLAIADRYPSKEYNFYLANYYHFCFLVGSDYQTAQQILKSKSQ